MHIHSTLYQNNLSGRNRKEEKDGLCNEALFEFDASTTIGRFSEAGLLEWMRFVIFRERTRERSQRTSGPISE